MLGMQLDSDLRRHEEQVVRLNVYHSLLDGGLVRVCAPVLGVRGEGGLHGRSALLSGQAR